MPLGKVLCEPGAVLQNVYFPTDSVISQVYVTADGASAQVSSVGNDGALGIALFLSGQSMTGHAIVQFAGSAYCLTKGRFQQELARHGEMQRIMLHYTHALLTETAQTVVCNRYHSVDQQLCRWLLVAPARLPSNRLAITQELLGGILGVRRESVTEAAGQVTEGRCDRLPPGKDHGNRPDPVGKVVLRVLRGGQEGNGSTVAVSFTAHQPDYELRACRDCCSPNGSMRASSPQFQLRRARPRGSAVHVCPPRVAAGWCARERLALGVGVAPIGSRYLL